jgi:hypothetical protein
VGENNAATVASLWPACVATGFRGVYAETEPGDDCGRNHEYFGFHDQLPEAQLFSYDREIKSRAGSQCWVNPD